jgi:acyl-CoA synthetase (AMP-forming)/AMP-acid ligase II
MVQAARGQEPLPHRGHLVADGDRRHHDLLLAGVTDEKPSHAAWPLPGVQPVLLTADGKEITENEVEGMLCMKFPWPGILRTIWGDHERYKQTYFSTYPGHYFSGDGAKRDAEGRYRIIGRVDDVINVSGHRFGTAEIESAINLSDRVVESAVVGYPHDIKGQGIYAYVITAEPLDLNDKAAVDRITGEIVESVVASIGRIAKPDKIQFVSGLPKTRSRQDHAPHPAQDRRGGNEQPRGYFYPAGPCGGGGDQGGEGVRAEFDPATFWAGPQDERGGAVATRV